MKKLVSLALALAMAAGMSISAYAAEKAVGFASGKTLMNGYNYSGDKISSDTASLGDIYASDEVERDIYLYKDMFADSSGKALGAAGEVLSSSDIRTSKIAVRSSLRGSSKVLKATPEINTSKGKITVQFATEWTSTNAEDFELTIYLTIDGKRYDDQAIILEGTIGNEELSVYGDQDYVDISDGRALYAEETVSKIEIDLGNGVSIFTKLVKGKTYYGTASNDIDSTDETFMNKYSDIVDVYNVKVTGLNASGDIVKLNTDYTGFIYDKDLNYLGKTDEMMPLSTKYYISTKKLDIADDDEPSESEPDESEPDDSEPDESKSDNNGGSGGGSGSGGGGNSIGNNPDTGSRSFVGIAVLAAVLSLAAGVVVLRKK